MDFDKILDDSNRRFDSRLKKEYEEIDRQHMIKLEEIKERHRKASFKLNVGLFICSSPLVFVLIYSFLDIRALSHKNDACVAAGGILVDSFDGYQCVTKDSFKVVEVK